MIMSVGLLTKKNTSEVAVVHNELKLSKKCNLIFGFGWMYCTITSTGLLALGSTPFENISKKLS